MDDSNVIDNIILDNSKVLAVEEINQGETVLFSSLKHDAVPLVPYDISIGGLEYNQKYEPKCAICNSPHRNLVEYVFINSGKNVQAVINFFQKHYNAKLNWPQVSLHLKRHCDLTQITTSGLVNLTQRDQELAKWKYREHELALVIILVEIDEVRGMSCRTPDEILKRATMMEKLSRQLLLIKEKRDDVSLGLPNVFEVLYELHEKMLSDDDKRIIRQKVKELQQALN